MTQDAYLSKSDAFQQWREDILPSIVREYERDGLPDRPARRESWNNHLDYLLRNGQVRDSAGNWGHPAGLETVRPLGGAA